MRHEDDLPWPQLMAFAFGVLGMAPENFWAMTPPEWLMAFEGFRKKHGMADITPSDISRDDLHELIHRFPD